MGTKDIVGVWKSSEEMASTILYTVQKLSRWEDEDQQMAIGSGNVTWTEDASVMK